MTEKDEDDEDEEKEADDEAIAGQNKARSRDARLSARVNCGQRGHSRAVRMSAVLVISSVRRTMKRMMEEEEEEEEE